MSIVALFNKNYIYDTILNISHTNISSLPAEIGNLINLQELCLSYNQLSLLPAEIGNLINLKELLLNHNQLSLLPADTEGASIHL